VNLALFVLLMGGAYIFDMYHIEDERFSIEANNHSLADQAKLYFCTPMASLTLKAPVEKILLKKSMQFNVARHLLLHHSSRAFHILKAEIPEFPDNILDRNLLAFRNYHFSNPDDLPPHV
jgi:hypothetical protein